MGGLVVFRTKDLVCVQSLTGEVRISKLRILSNLKVKVPPCFVKRARPRLRRGARGSDSPALWSVLRRVLGGEFAHALGVKHKSLGFGLGALGGDFMAVPEEGDAGGVADAGYDFAGGVDCGVGRSNQSFLRHELAVGGYGDPGSFCGADDEAEGGDRFSRWGGGLRTK